jgi:hypothetical protein
MVVVLGGIMAPKLSLALFVALASTTLVSCIVGSDGDDNSAAGSSGRGGATSGGSGGDAASGGTSGSDTGGSSGTSGSGTGGSETGGTSGSGTGGKGGSGTGGTDIGGTGGRGTGGSDTGGTGGGNTGGTESGGTGGQACCLAIPTCAEGEEEVDQSRCLGGAPCREVSLCCSTVWCLPTSQCQAIPVCDDGDEEIEGECPASSSCYSRTVCGTTITCEEGKDSGGECNPEEEPDRNYVGDSPEECAVIDFACPEHTEYFGNDCGCGCEQAADCPDYVDCMPGPEPRPGCSTEERARCPYTVVAF